MFLPVQSLGFLLAGFVQNALIVLPICLVLMFALGVTITEVVTGFVLLRCDVSHIML